tara:strand:- start:207 stop:983 length:777 start_codon:yes stop_codon:yes gene_type:complete
MSKIKVNEIEKASGSGITVPTGTSFTVVDGVGVAGGGTGLTSFTAGDLLYATGSTTLAKLPKGTANQTLQMNGGATAPTWVTASSGGLVKLGQVTASDDSSVSLNGLFTSDYKIYKIFGREIVGASDNKALRCKWRNSGGLISSAYYNSHSGIYNNSSTNNALLNRQWNGDHMNIGLNGLDQSNQYGMDFEMNIYDPQSSTRHKNHMGFTTHDVYDQTLIYSYTFGGYLNNTGTMTGLDFYMDSGNINGIFTLYGIKN